jgi:tellurite resistance protein TerC
LSRFRGTIGPTIMPATGLFFPFAEFWWLYAAFILGVMALLALDLGVFHRTAHAVSMREATVWSAIWIVLALGVNYALFAYASATFPASERLLAIEGFDPAAAARQVGLEFLTGYIVEKSLAVDNIFVFVVVFSFFAIPPAYQHRVLFYGILGALIFRAIFVAMGAVLMQYHLVVLLFGVFLILTGLKMMVAPDTPLAPERNPLIRIVRRLVPVTPDLEGHRFFVRRAGVWHATPLFVALVFLEFSDIVFAVDSVPAIFAITREPLIVFMSNVMAILGLRSMYFLLVGAVELFHLLKYGLAAVLVFVGLKMVWLNDAFGGKFPIGLSLGIIAGLIGLAIAASLLWPRKRGPGPEGAGAGAEA